MANIHILKRRINAAKNVSKTTRAMQMIAASKLKKAQNAVLSSRPYVNKISEVIDNLIEKTDKKYTNPYLDNKSGADKTLLLILSPDKGLCGGLITNLVREFTKYQKETPETSYVILGKKLEGQVLHFENEIIASFPFGTTLPSFSAIYPLIKIIEENYNSGKVKNVKILTTEFESLFRQVPKVTNLLPLSKSTLDTEDNTDDFYLFEPNKKELLDSLLKHYFEMSLYQKLIEAYLSEQASRMISMQNATTNANDIIDDLQLEYNKTRQAKITSELLDMTGVPGE